MSRVVIIMASKGDLNHCRKISKCLDRFDVDHVMRVASAHKVPLKVLKILEEYSGAGTVFITSAGRSNALSGFVDANTQKPVIACPPPSDKFGGVDIFSSIRMPSGVCPLFVLEPEEAALAAMKILAVSDAKLREKIRKYQDEKRRVLERDDEEVKSNG